MLRYLLLLLILAVAAHAQVPMGASKNEVIDAIGWPKSVSGTSSREILNYPEFTIYLVDGKVVNLQMKPVPPGKKPKAAAPAVSPKVKPTPARPPAYIRPAPAPNPTPTPSLQSPVTTRRSQYQPPAKQDTIGSVVFRTLAPVAVLFGLLVVLKLIFGKKLERKSREMRDELARDSNDAERRALSLPPKLRARPDPIKDGWNLELLKLLEWHRFEQVVAEYHRLLGNRAELTAFGPDGGIDVEVYRPSEPTPFLLIQCKAWAHEFVGVALIRELFGVAAARRIPGTAFHTTSTYSSDARNFAASVNMELVDGPEFIARIKGLPLSSQLRLHEFATAGDYTIPTCSRCGTKMVLRTARQGRNAGNDFWACSSCNNTMNVRRA